MIHNKETFVREYCKCRNVKYSFNGETLFINGVRVCYSIYNHIYTELVEMIDSASGKGRE